MNFLRNQLKKCALPLPPATCMHMHTLPTAARTIPYDNWNCNIRLLETHTPSLAWGFLLLSHPPSHLHTGSKTLNRG